MRVPFAALLSLVIAGASAAPAQARLNDTLEASITLARDNHIPEATFFVRRGRVVGEAWKAFVGTQSPLARQQGDDDVPHCYWPPELAARYRTAMVGDVEFQHYAAVHWGDGAAAPLIPGFIYAGDVRVRYTLFCGEATDDDFTGDTDEIIAGTTTYWQAFEHQTLHSLHKFKLIGQDVRRIF